MFKCCFSVAVEPEIGQKKEQKQNIYCNKYAGTFLHTEESDELESIRLSSKSIHLKPTGKIEIEKDFNLAFNNHILGFSSCEVKSIISIDESKIEIIDLMGKSTICDMTHDCYYSTS